MDSIAERLERLMHGRRVRSQSQLARDSGVPQSTINRILKKGDAYSPTWATLKRLAEYFRVSVLWLAEGRGSPQVPLFLESEVGYPGPDLLPSAGLEDDRITEAVAILRRLDDDERRMVLDVLRLIGRPRSEVRGKFE